MEFKRRVILESPYAGEVERNLAYARAAVRDCARRGESALASHLLWAQPGITNDADPDERALGIELGLVWGAAAAATVVYVDHGISPGMLKGIERAIAEGRKVEYRALIPRPAEGRSPSCTITGRNPSDHPWFPDYEAPLFCGDCGADDARMMACRRCYEGHAGTLLLAQSGHLFRWNEASQAHEWEKALPALGGDVEQIWEGILAEPAPHHAPATGAG